MTQKIIELAKEAGFNVSGDLILDDMGYVTITNRLEAFAKLVLANIDPSKFMSWQEGYEAGRDAGRAEQQADMESLYAMYKQACAQRDMLMDQQRAQIAAMRGQIQ